MDEEIRINSVGADGVRSMEDARDLRSFESKHRGDRLTDTRVSGRGFAPKDFIKSLQYFIAGKFHAKISSSAAQNVLVLRKELEGDQTKGSHRKNQLGS